MQEVLTGSNPEMFSHRRVVSYWLVLAAASLLIIGVFTYQRINRHVADSAGTTRANASQSVATLQTVVVVSSAFALLSVLFASLQMRSEWKHRQQVELELQHALASVEHQVAERTEALSRTMAELKEAIDERAAALVRAEAARRVAEEASNLKDEFLATASHELRTPLNAIVGWVHVLQSGAATDEAERHAVSAIARNAKIQTRLIEDLLDVSRMMQGRVSLTAAPIDVRTAVVAAVDTVKTSASAKDISLTVEMPPKAVPIIGDELRLQQVVWNLLANAVKYTERGGRITVAVTPSDEHVSIAVTDTGVGIDGAFLPHLFEPLRQGASSTMRSGMGLGLAIARRLVDLHGGRITAESAGLGKGARFAVSLPLAPDSAQAVAGAPRPDSAFHKLHVLVVEDDADSAAAVTAILRLHGCETRTAATASECLRITGEWPTDVLVCDIGLPDDDGYGLLRRLRNLPEGENIPAIALTAYARPEDRVRALAAGFLAHLSKPLDPDSLLREISSAVSAVHGA